MGTMSSTDTRQPTTDGRPTDPIDPIDPNRAYSPAGLARAIGRA
jgi:hypothetical protein